MDQQRRLFEGSCHCKRVIFKFQGSRHKLVAWRCNCSVCHMRQNHHTMVPKGQLQILSGRQELTEYRFGTNVAVHLFCRHCGITPFYSPRSNPDCWAVTIYCFDAGDTPVQIRDFDGINWQTAYRNTGIKAMSPP